MRWDHGQLWVDGKLSAHRPLNPSVLPDLIELSVPTGSYCILPTTILNAGRAMTVRDWYELSIVNTDGIQGRVFLRNYPLARWWWIE